MYPAKGESKFISCMGACNEKTTKSSSFYDDEEIWRTAVSGLQGLLDGEAIRQDHQLYNSPFDFGDNFEVTDCNYGEDFELLMQLDSSFQVNYFPPIPEYTLHGLIPNQSPSEDSVAETQHATSTTSKGRTDDDIVCYGMVSADFHSSNTVVFRTVRYHDTSTV